MILKKKKKKKKKKKPQIPVEGRVEENLQADASSPSPSPAAPHLHFAHSLLLVRSPLSLQVFILSLQFATPDSLASELVTHLIFLSSSIRIYVFCLSLGIFLHTDLCILTLYVFV